MYLSNFTFDQLHRLESKVADSFSVYGAKNYQKAIRIVENQKLSLCQKILFDLKWIITHTSRYVLAET